MRKKYTKPGHLRWAIHRYWHASNDEFVVFAALVLAWFFLLRGGEFCLNPSSPWQLDRVIRGADVRPQLDGRPTDKFEDADEVVLHLRGSKGDQFNESQERNLFRSGEDLCPVRVMAELQRRFPQRWSSEADLPLFRKSD